MDAEFADGRVDRRHLGGKVGRNLHLLARGEDVELVGIKDQSTIVSRPYWFPIILRGVATDLINVDNVSILNCAVANDAIAQPPKRHTNY